MDDDATPYLSYSRYLRARHGCAVYRVAVDAGFGCPHRGDEGARGGVGARPGRAGEGCAFCAAHGSRASYTRGGDGAGEESCGMDMAERVADLGRQVCRGTAFLRRRYGAEAFTLFFQPYSNTHAPVEELRAIYDAGLSLERFRGLSVATRPDCIDGPRADLLASYAGPGLEVWCELGLQSANDETLRLIHRGHTVEDFRRAAALLRARGVRVAAHLIFGLPGEGRAQIMATIDEMARLGIDGVKIHNLHVPAGTALARDYAAGELTAPGPARHLEWVLEAVERLPPRTVIMRLQCDTPRAELLAPRRFWEKQRFAAALQRAMRARGARQGRLCGAVA